MGFLRRATERRTVQQFGDSSIPTNGSLAAPTASGVPVNEQTAMKLIAVHACVRIISSALAGRPLRSMQKRDDVLVPITPAPAIVTDPFGGLNSTRFPSRRAGLKQMAVSLLLRGNAYAYVLTRDYLGRPTRLMVLHPSRVRVELDDDGGRTYYLDRQRVENPGDIVHITGLCMPGAAEGMSVIAYARQSIGLGLAAEEFGAKFFGQGAHLTGVVEMEANLDKTRARELKESFEASHSGLPNAHAIGVLSGGATWKPISVAPEDAQFLGTRAAANLDMAMLFGVPPHMLGQIDRTTSWGTGIEQQAIGFRIWTLDDWLGTFEDAWTTLLPRGQYARLDTTSLERTDTAGRYNAYVQGRTAGLLTQNEIRAKENLAPVDGGDDINAPLNSAHAGDTAEPDQPPEPPDDPPVPAPKPKK
ncbi:phage portal protein [Streptomyces sp. NPDC005281]|uniref:phage portal protein n=1 Tax=Streptomyces sp. NPDC005281 TaxID=3155712 RepID=UPI0033B94970